jgi:YVTN family beta-propeller protein
VGYGVENVEAEVASVQNASLFVLCLLTCSLGGCKKKAAAVDSPSQDRIYVSNEDSNDVSVIDSKSDSVIKTISVGKRPRGLRVSQDGTRLFVALSGSPKAGPGVDESKLPPADRSADGIGIVDLKKNAVERVLQSGRDPESFDITADGKQLLVSNEETAETSVIDIAGGNIVRAIPVGGEPEGVTLRPDGAVAYVTSEADNEVHVIDIKRQNVLTRIKSGQRPRAVAFTPDGKRAYVTDELGATVTAIDAERHVPIGSVDLRSDKPTGPASKPMGVVVSPDGKFLYVTTGRGGAVAVVDSEALKVVKVISDVGPRPWGIGITPDGRKLYVANGPSNDVSVVELPSGKILKRLKVGTSPWGIAVGR